ALFSVYSIVSSTNESNSTQTTTDEGLSIPQSILLVTFILAVGISIVALIMHFIKRRRMIRAKRRSRVRIEKKKEKRMERDKNTMSTKNRTRSERSQSSTRTATSSNRARLLTASSSVRETKPIENK
ncbi:hypothetical protein PENTCL1PPCAC_2074, partial [Pristionchus entomophagus]